MDYHTLNDFRVAHEKSLDGLFTKVLTALTGRGVVRIGRISRDGKRVRASVVKGDCQAIAGNPSADSGDRS